MKQINLILIILAIAFGVHAQPNASNDTETGSELLVFDLNRAVTEADRGFPKYGKVAAPSQNIVEMFSGTNGNWVYPVNYAEGILMMRVEIFSQPVPQEIKLQFCIWQDDLAGNSLGLETCTPLSNMVGVSGVAGTVVTGSGDISTMWKKNGVPLDWTRSRERYGIAIKNSNGEPVSDYSGWNWYGENPKDWYPLNMRYTIVAVPKEETFSGWSNYIQTTGIGNNPVKRNGGLLECFPNPFHTGINIGFYLNSNEDVKLSIYDIYGRKVWDMVESRPESGYNNIYFDAEGLKPGLYFCKLSSGQYIETRKIVLL